MTTTAHRLYGAAAVASAVAVRFAAKRPGLEAAVLSGPRARLLVVINHVHRALKTTIEDAGSGARIPLDLAGKEVRLFGLEGERRTPLPLAEGESSTA